MSVQRVKVWQWVLISLVVGVGLGYAWTAQSDLEGPGTMNRREFYNLLAATTDDGQPIVQDIVIGPVLLGSRGERVQRVTFKRMMRHRETGRWDPIPSDTIAEIPYIKTDANPDNRLADHLDKLRERIPAIGYSYARLAVSTLERPVDQPEDAGRLTRIANAFVRGLPDDRELAFWQKPTFAWLIALGGSVALIGVAWPMVIRAMVRMGLGMPDEPMADLSQVRSSSSAPVIAAKSVSQSDRDALDDLNARLEENVAGMLIESDEGDAAEARREDAEEAALIKKLNNTPLESQASTAPPEQPKDYQGEFYPVAKKKA
jgi:hypothetical protein